VVSVSHKAGPQLGKRDKKMPSRHRADVWPRVGRLQTSDHG
jgi:hypothetical protein